MVSSTCSSLCSNLKTKKETLISSHFGRQNTIKAFLDIKNVALHGAKKLILKIEMPFLFILSLAVYYDFVLILLQFLIKYDCARNKARIVKPPY